jgi:hypothetical protein
VETLRAVSGGFNRRRMRNRNHSGNICALFDIQRKWGWRMSDASDARPRAVRFDRFEFDRLTGELADGNSRTTSLARNRLILPITESTGNIWMLDNIDR